MKASLIRSKYLQIVKVGELLDDTNMQTIVDNYIATVLKQSSNTPIQSSAITTVIEPIDTSITLSEAFESYCKWYKKTDIQERQYKTVTNRLKVAISFFGATKYIKEFTTECIEEYIDFLKQFPNTNQRPYCRMTFDEIISLSIIPVTDIISTATLIKYMKAFKQMENYLVDDGKLDRRISKRANIPTSISAKTKEFTQFDIRILFNLFNTLDDRKFIYYTYALTGMRTSEFWKCKIGIEEGIYFFDLSYKAVELKTESSKRKIPIHSKLLNMGIVEKIEDIQESFNQQAISLYFNNTIINELEDHQDKVMYCFRHTMATELKRANVNIDKISELLGHSYENSTITKTTYASKYSLSQLQEAIELLPYN